MRIDTPVEIVGIVGHVHHWGLDKDSTAKVRSELYMPFVQIPDRFMTAATGGNTILIRTTANPLTMADAVRAQVIGSNRDQPVYGLRTMRQIVQEGLAQRRFAMMLLGVFAAPARRATRVDPMDALRCE